MDNEEAPAVVDWQVNDNCVVKHGPSWARVIIESLDIEKNKCQVGVGFGNCWNSGSLTIHQLCVLLYQYNEFATWIMITDMSACRCYLHAK